MDQGVSAPRTRRWTAALPASALLAALPLLAAVGCDRPRPSAGGLGPEVVGDLDRLLEQSLEELDVPGVCAGLRVEEVGSYERCVGVARSGSDEPMHFDRHVRIGSVTKTVTATLLLRLMEEGALALDDPVAKYVEGSPKPEVTLRQLATMTSGIATYTFDPGFQTALFHETEKSWRPAELLAIAAEETRAGCPNQPGFCFEAGEGWAYSNTNYLLLGLVVEAASGGQSYQSLLEKYVTGPLGMTETYRPEDGTLPEPFAHGYTVQTAGELGPRRDATYWNPSWGFGTGDLVSTPRELATWAEALGTGRLLEPETREIQRTKTILPPNTPEHAYAVGVGYQDGWWGHEGLIPGYNSQALYHPEARATLVVSVNHDLVEVDGEEVHPARRIADRMVEIASRRLPLGDLPAESHTDDPSL